MPWQMMMTRTEIQKTMQHGPISNYPPTHLKSENRPPWADHAKIQSVYHRGVTIKSRISAGWMAPRASMFAPMPVPRRDPPRQTVVRPHHYHRHRLCLEHCFRDLQNPVRSMRITQGGRKKCCGTFFPFAILFLCFAMFLQVFFRLKGLLYFLWQR